MLHDPSHVTPAPTTEPIELPPADRAVLRELAERVAQVAAMSVHRDTAALWTRLNDLDSLRPMVWVNEIPWHEMDVDGELALRTSHPWAREQETQMRQTLYQWKHMPADMVVSDFLECPLALHSSDFGIIEEVDIATTDAASGIYSRRFHRQISGPEDIEKIRMPTVTHNEAASRIALETMRDLYEDIMPVRQVGQTHIWFTPWDYLIRWWGVEEAMVDLVNRPEMVHAAVDRMVDAWMVELDQFVALNALSLDNRNIRVGSGGYGYVSGLPGGDYDPARVRPHNMWGCSNAQIFAQVSPEMHWQFALEHDLRWLSRWGLTYYGCCEPLHLKMGLLQRVPNLRKVSMSPWVDLTKAVEAVGDRYIFSFKPNPALLAEDHWRPEAARAHIRQVLDLAGGRCHIELIFKDISTVRYQPQRLWEWTAIAQEEAARCAG
ncbi:MAG: hypothetical protein ABFD92_13295 [Planctomycetaceae bacterium]|nr:hypothetical protein [Planctomycetaceae bacterium]